MKNEKPCIFAHFGERMSVFIVVYQNTQFHTHFTTHTQPNGGIKEFLHPILFDRLFYLYRKERKEKIKLNTSFLMYITVSLFFMCL